MNLYICMANNDGVGIINEIKEYPFEPSRYCVVKKYEVLYNQELHRFQENPLKNYALPHGIKPSHYYYGIGRVGTDGKYIDSEKRCTLSPKDIKLLQKYEEFDVDDNNLFFCEKDAEKYLSFLDNRDEYEIVWTRIHNCEDKVPEDYLFIGYDITYPPEMQGAFSIICDCMFVCMWHGCDIEGTSFIKYFIELNENGLFNDYKLAFEYLKNYISYEWTERGEFCICEVYRKTLPNP